jgi:hypothetical protein
MARTSRNETDTNAQVEDTTPEAQEDPWAEIETVSLAEENAPDARLVERLKLSDAARKEGKDAIGYRIVVANGEVAKSRIAEIRRAGGVNYANCGVGISQKNLGDGKVEVVFKARKRRGSEEEGKAENGTGEAAKSE